MRFRGLIIALMVAGTAVVGGQSFDATLAWQSPLEHWASDVEFSRYGTYLACAQYDGSIAVFRTNGSEGPMELLWNVTSRSRRQRHWDHSMLAFTPDERFLVIGAHLEDQTIGVMDMRSGEVTQRLNAHRDGVDSVTVTPDGTRIITAGEQELAVWELTDGELREVARRRVAQERIPDMTVTPDGATLIAADIRTDTIALFRLDSGTDGGPIPAGRLEPRQYYTNTGYLHHVDVSANGRWIATVVRKELTIWERVQDGYEVAAVFPDIGTNMTGVTFGPDARWLFVTDMYRVYTFEHSAGRWSRQHTIRPGAVEIKDIDLSPGGGLLAIAGAAYENGNAVEAWALPGMERGPVAALQEYAGGGFSGAQRAFVDYQNATEILDGIDPALTAPQEMFETELEFAERRARVGASVKRALAERTEAHLGAAAEPTEDGRATVEVPVDGPGQYEIETQEYILPAAGTELTLTLDRDAARDLYRNWQDARLRVLREETPEGYWYGAFEIVHPTLGTTFAAQPDENPFTSERIDPITWRAPSIAVGPNLMMRNVTIDGIFPSLYRVYARRPVGSATLVNTGPRVSALEIDLFLPQMMDRPSRADAPAFVDVNGTADVALRAALNRTVLELTEGDTAGAAITVRYSVDGTWSEEQVSIPVQVLNRNAIRWDDDRKVAAFMSVNDPAVLRFANHAVGAAEDLYTQTLSRNFLHAMRVFQAMRATAITYVVDPSSAYAEISRDALGIDFLRFPAQTLEYRSGDCDDLSVLYNTLLEAVGIPTAFVTTPGHIFTAFDMGVAPELAPRLFSRPEDLISHQGRTWAPIETTALREGFLRAWEIGATQWRAATEAGIAAIFTTQAAWAEYEPVLIPDAPTPPLPSAPEIRDGHQAQLERFRERELSALLHELESRGGDATAPAYRTRYGLLYARYGELEAALEQFAAAAEKAPYLPALLNAANVQLLLGNASEALGFLDRAREVSPEDPRVFLALTVGQMKTGDLRGAEQAYRRLELIDPELARRYPLFATTEEAGTRASAQTAADRYLQEGWTDPDTERP